MLKQIAQLDVKLSSFLHRCESGLIALLLLPSGAFHNGALGLLIQILLVYFYLVDWNASLQNRAAKPGEHAGMTLAWILTVFLMLLTTRTLKKRFGRDRPIGPKKGEPTYRMVNLRGRENNHSFPSGDAAQGSNWICFLAINFPAIFERLGGTKFGVIYVLLVMTARVYYHCHFWGDTIFGAALGPLINTLTGTIGLSAVMCSLFA